MHYLLCVFSNSPRTYATASCVLNIQVASTTKKGGPQATLLRIDICFSTYTPAGTLWNVEITVSNE